MSTPASSAVFPIFDTTPDGPTANTSFILLIDSLNVTLSLKQDAQDMIPETRCSYLMETLY